MTGQPIVVVETDHGIDGWDAKSRDVATYDDWRDAMIDLAERGYSVDFDGKPISTAIPPRNKMIYHAEVKRRHCMGCITYELRNLPEPLPHNRLP